MYFAVWCFQYIETENYNRLLQHTRISKNYIFNKRKFLWTVAISNIMEPNSHIIERKTQNIIKTTV